MRRWIFGRWILVGALLACSGAADSMAENPAASRGSCKKALDRLDVLPEFWTGTAGASQTMTGTPYSACNGVLSLPVTWVSRNSSIATVASTGAKTGKVTAIDTGTTYIVGTVTQNAVTKTDSARIEVTGASTPPPPPPTATCSGGATIINVGDNWQTKVNAAATGTTFCAKSGTHVRQSVIPKTGQKFVGETGAVMDGQNSTATAFSGSAANVVIKHLKIIRYHPADASQGMIQAPNAAWTVDSNEIAYSAMQGFRVGKHSHVGWNEIHDNYVTGGGGYKADSMVVEYNHFYRNPPTFTSELSGGTRMSQIKVFATTGVIIRNNLFENGAKKGIWLDTDNYLALIQGNTIRSQGQACIWYEANYSGIISTNTLQGCGVNNTLGWIQNACVQVTNSASVEIANNICSGADNGIVGMAVGHAANPDYTTGSRGLKALGIHAHDNTITQSSGIAAGVQVTGTGADTAFTWSGKSTFVDNHYNTTGNSASAWSWLNANRTKSQWQSFGFDVTGTFVP